MSYVVYILRCTDDTLYTGITTDVARRLVEHQSGRGAKYTRTHGAVDILYKRKFATRGRAQVREAEIKKMTREHKLALIALGK